MPEALPVIRVDRVTAAVTVCPGPPTVMDVLLTAVTLPITKSVPVPPGPVPGSAPPRPGWLLPPGATGARKEGWPAARGGGGGGGGAGGGGGRGGGPPAPPPTTPPPPPRGGGGRRRGATGT